MATVAKKEQTRQLAFRVPESVAKRVEKVATRLGLDTSNFLRMMLVENLIAYERRVERAEQGDAAGDD